MTNYIITFLCVYVFTLAYIYTLKIVFKFKGNKRLHLSVAHQSDTDCWRRL